MKFPGWFNWSVIPPPANVMVEFMYQDGRKYGTKIFENPNDTWHPPVHCWYWRIPPAGLFYDPFILDLDTFKQMRGDRTRQLKFGKRHV